MNHYLESEKNKMCGDAQTCSLAIHQDGYLIATPRLTNIIQSKMKTSNELQRFKKKNFKFVCIRELFLKLHVQSFKESKSILNIRGLLEKSTKITYLVFEFVSVQKRVRELLHIKR